MISVQYMAKPQLTLIFTSTGETEPEVSVAVVEDDPKETTSRLEC